MDKNQAIELSGIDPSVNEIAFINIWDCLVINNKTKSNNYNR